jgi:hypothetical protein
MKTVVIDIAAGTPFGIPNRRRIAADLANDLLKAGYALIELSGLQKFRPKFRDGLEWNAVALPVDSDAESLIISYDRLLHDMAAKSSFRHSVYLIDGAFEITALVEKEFVKLRVGEYREPFLLTSPDGVEITIDEYVSLWHRIAWALETAA